MISSGDAVPVDRLAGKKTMKLYDNPYDWIDYSHVQVRFVLNTEHGIPPQVLVQLEYRLEGEWESVVRFDHNPDTPKRARYC
jgi:hypothetical protein